MKPNRRDFLRQMSIAAAGCGIASIVPSYLRAQPAAPKLFFDISLAEFSFASDLWSNKMTNLDFPAKAKKDFGITVVEYVAMFFNNKHTDSAYLADLKKRADDEGVKNNLIMVDGENLSDLDDA